MGNDRKEREMIFFFLKSGIKDEKEEEEVGWVKDEPKKVSYQKILSISMRMLVSVCVNI